MALKIEVGKTYRMRNGEALMKCLYGRTGAQSPMLCVGVGRGTWEGEVAWFAEDGGYYLNGEESLFDLVTEVVDEVRVTLYANVYPDPDTGLAPGGRWYLTLEEADVNSAGNRVGVVHCEFTNNLETGLGRVS